MRMTGQTNEVIFSIYIVPIHNKIYPKALSTTSRSRPNSLFRRNPKIPHELALGDSGLEKKTAF